MSEKYTCISSTDLLSLLLEWPVENLAHHEHGGGSRGAVAGAPGQLCFLIRRPEPHVSMATKTRKLHIKGREISIKQNLNKGKQHKNIDIRQNS